MTQNSEYLPQEEAVEFQCERTGEKKLHQNQKQRTVWKVTAAYTACAYMNDSCPCDY